MSIFLAGWVVLSNKLNVFWQKSTDMTTNKYIYGPKTFTQVLKNNDQILESENQIIKEISFHQARKIFF